MLPWEEWMLCLVPGVPGQLAMSLPAQRAWDSPGTGALLDFFLVFLAPGLVPWTEGMPGGWMVDGWLGF